MCLLSQSLQPGGHSLLLGWNSPECRPSMGFCRAEPAQNPVEQAILYGGDGHLMSVAPTGAGKGRGVIIPNLLTYEGPIITIDPKGENYQVTASRRRAMGQRVVLLDPFQVTKDGSDALNPMDIFDLDKSILECDAEMLASMMSFGHEFETDRYWNDTGTGLNTGWIAHIGSSATGPERTLNELRRKLHHDDMDYHIAVLLDQKEIKSNLARDEFVAYLSAPADKTRPCIRSTAITYVKMLGSQAVAQTLGPSTFDLADVVRGTPMTIYLVIPPEKLDSHKGLLRLWVATLLTAVTSRRHIPPLRTLFLLDECAQLGHLPALKQSITLLRGYGLQVWSFWQDLAQLQGLYPKDWKTMVNNAAVLQTFGMHNHQMARDWSDVLGWDATDVAELPATDALLYQHGLGCRRCRRADYLRDAVFTGLYEPNERFSLLPREEERQGMEIG